MKPANHRKRLFTAALTAFLATIGLCGPASAMEAHESITGPFADSGSVTKICLKCHNQQAADVLNSAHWTWERQRIIDNETVTYGKKDSLAGFAVDVASNPARCQRCHVSNTRPDIEFAAPAPEMVDCLLCHDTTGTYNLTAPDKTNLEKIARNVGRPGPANCTTCHFADCGLSQESGSEKLPMRDIHITRTKNAFTCQTCHVRHNGHNLSRTVDQTGTPSGDGTGCASCHTAKPHSLAQINLHTTAIACQTCHIPQYALEKPVLVNWNWLMTGGPDRVMQHNGQDRTALVDENGIMTATKLEPVYLWDDGSDQVYTRGSRIKPNEPVYLQKPSDRSDTSKIMPFRVISSTQMYDAKYRYLISPRIHPSGPSYFSGNDWDVLAQQGMQAIVLPFSGQYGFTATTTYRRINHGVVRADKALGCLDCHGATGRMDWKQLGYEGDPWESKTGEGKTQPANTNVF